MAQIGNFGKIKFYVKTDKKNKPKALSFHDLSMESGANYEMHERLNKKSYLEFVGPDNAEISLTIEASASLGVDPWTVRKKLHEIQKAGKAHKLVIGGHKLGSYLWVITNISESFKEFYIDGRPTAISFNVSFLEYPKIAKPKKKSKKKKKKKSSNKSGNSTSSKSSKNTAKRTSFTRYVVKRGDTLWGLAVKYYKKGSKYTKIFNANKKPSKGYDVIKNPNRIYVGMVIKIPNA